MDVDDEKSSAWIKAPLTLSARSSQSTSAPQRNTAFEHQYDALLPTGSDADSEGIFLPTSRPTLSIRHTILFVFLPLSILAAFMTLYAALGGSKPQSAPAPWLHCGNSSSEARAQGCAFDVMMHSWVPAPCYDKELSEMYIAANDFKFYTDSQALNLMPLEEVRKGDFVELWTGLTHHVLHCAYIWRLLGMSATEGRPFDSLSSSEDHTGHCTAILLHGLPWTKPFIGNESSLTADFLKCGYY